MLNRNPKAYLAFDLGAESGRAVIGRLHSGILTINEVHRFPNEPVTYGESLHWDVSRLWFEMRSALSAVEDTPLSGIGVDTWGVDYALLGERGELLQNPYHYREPHNVAAMAEVASADAPRRDLCHHRHSVHANQHAESAGCGQNAAAAVAVGGRSIADDPGSFQLLARRPALCEFTIASTTQMVNASTRRAGPAT